MSDESGWEETEVPDSDGVRRRIAELGNGLTVELFHDAVRIGQQAGDFCTSAHPVYGLGMIVHIETNGQLRGQLMIRGWTLDNELNVPRIVSPDETIIITAISGDDRTGLPRDANGEHAQTKTPRGPGGRHLIRRNAQGLFTPMLPVNDPELQGAPVGGMWYLLYYRVPGTDTVRCELSFAAKVSESGTLIDWRERLILPEINLLEGPPPDRERGNDDGPDVDVPVHRRSG
jgi:hypothetical protein